MGNNYYYLWSLPTMLSSLYLNNAWASEIKLFFSTCDLSLTMSSGNYHNGIAENRSYVAVNKGYQEQDAEVTLFDKCATKVCKENTKKCTNRTFWIKVSFLERWLSRGKCKNFLSQEVNFFLPALIIGVIILVSTLSRWDNLKPDIITAITCIE